MTLEAQFADFEKRQRDKWRDEISAEDRIELSRSFLHVGEIVAGDEKLSASIEKVLAYIAAEQAISLDNPKFDMRAEEAHKRDTYDRGVVSGMDRALRTLTDQKVISSMVEELRPGTTDERK